MGLQCPHDERVRRCLEEMGILVDVDPCQMRHQANVILLTSMLVWDTGNVWLFCSVVLVPIKYQF